MLPDILLDYKSFLRKEPFGAHSGAWKAQLKDRLDAEHYVAFEERATSDLDTLRKSMSAFRARAEAADKALIGFDEIFASLETEPRLLSDLLTQVQSKQKLERDGIYRLLGVRWWGGGAFVRETKRGSEIKAKKLYEIAENLIVYNRLFAFRGSFAVTTANHNGCLASNEFPTFKINDDINNPALVAQYIVGCLSSPQYLAAVDADSTGSTKTSRNRFNEKQFLQMTVHMPAQEDDLVKVVGIISEASELRQQQEQLHQLAKTLREDVLGALPRP